MALSCQPLPLVTGIKKLLRSTVDYSVFNSRILPVPRFFASTHIFLVHQLMRQMECNLFGTAELAIKWYDVSQKTICHRKTSRSLHTVTSAVSSETNSADPQASHLNQLWPVQDHAKAVWYSPIVSPRTCTHTCNQSDSANLLSKFISILLIIWSRNGSLHNTIGSESVAKIWACQKYSLH